MIHYETIKKLNNRESNLAKEHNWLVNRGYEFDESKVRIELKMLEDVYKFVNKDLIEPILLVESRINNL